MSRISTPSDMDYINAAGGGDTGGGLSVQGLPIVKPPWGRITAIDLNKGEIVWQVPHGDTLETVRDHPLLKGATFPRTGRIGPIGTLTTKTLVISGESGFTRLPSGQRGSWLRAYDKRTGEDVADLFMPAPQTGSPMTYMLNGKQYLVIAISGAGFPAELIHIRHRRGNSTELIQRTSQTWQSSAERINQAQPAGNGSSLDP